MKKLILAALAVPLIICACSKPADTASTAGDSGTPPPTKTDAAKTDAPKIDSTTPPVDHSKEAPAPSAAPAGKPDPSLVGAWKIDLAKSTIPPGATADEKKQMEALRITLKADGTCTIGDGKHDQAGKWGAEGKKLTLVSAMAGPPPLVMTVSADGKEFSATKPGPDGKPTTMTMMKV